MGEEEMIFLEVKYALSSLRGGIMLIFTVAMLASYATPERAEKSAIARFLRRSSAGVVRFSRRLSSWAWPVASLIVSACIIAAVVTGYHRPAITLFLTHRSTLGLLGGVVLGGLVFMAGAASATKRPEGTKIGTLVSRNLPVAWVLLAAFLLPAFAAQTVLDTPVLTGYGEALTTAVWLFGIVVFAQSIAERSGDDSDGASPPAAGRDA